MKASAKKASGNKSTGKQASLSSFFKLTAKKGGKAASADVDMTAGATGDGEEEEEETKGGAAKEVTNLDEEEKLAYLSKVVKSGSVETFNWEYTDRKFELGRKK